MIRSHLLALRAAAALCLLASHAQAERASASQALYLAVDLPSSFSHVGPQAGPVEPVVLAAGVPRAAAEAAICVADGGSLRWATWAPTQEPRSVTVQLRQAPPEGLQVQLWVMPGEGARGAGARALPLGCEAQQVLTGLAGGGLQDAALRYEATVSPGAGRGCEALTVVYTLGE